MLVVQTSVSRSSALAGDGVRLESVNDGVSRWRFDIDILIFALGGVARPTWRRHLDPTELVRHREE